MPREYVPYWSGGAKDYEGRAKRAAESKILKRIFQLLAPTRWEYGEFRQVCNDQQVSPSLDGFLAQHSDFPYLLACERLSKAVEAALFRDWVLRPNRLGQLARMWEASAERLGAAISSRPLALILCGPVLDRFPVDLWPVMHAAPPLTSQPEAVGVSYAPTRFIFSGLRVAVPREEWMCLEALGGFLKGLPGEFF